jgi:uncharacterized membrane protein
MRIPSLLARDALAGLVVLMLNALVWIAIGSALAAWSPAIAQMTAMTSGMDTWLFFAGMALLVAPVLTVVAGLFLTVFVIALAGLGHYALSMANRVACMVFVLLWW